MSITAISPFPFAAAFSSPSVTTVTRHRHQRRCPVLSAIGNRDFERIFGKQEAAERRIRDLAREYNPPSKKVVEELYKNEGVEVHKNIDAKQANTTRISNSITDIAKTIASKVKNKYIPPPHL